MEEDKCEVVGWAGAMVAAGAVAGHGSMAQ